MLMKVEEFDEIRHALGVIASEVRLSLTVLLRVQVHLSVSKLGSHVLIEND